MTEIRRVEPREARQKVQQESALLVCAYESEALCGRNNLEGSLFLREFTERVPTLDQGQEIVFYCA